MFRELYNKIHSFFFSRQSKRLTKFYNAYNDWLEAGAPEDNEYGFSRKIGLCGSIAYYYEKQSLSVSQKVIAEQTRQFIAAGLDKGYPFGYSAYYVGMSNNNNHLDPNRVAWVKAHLKRQIKKEFTLQ